MTTDFAAYLADKHAIEQVYIRYCDIIDQKAFDQLDETFAGEVARVDGLFELLREEFRGERPGRAAQRRSQDPLPRRLPLGPGAGDGQRLRHHRLRGRTRPQL